MNVLFRPIRGTDIKDFEYIAKWYNDPEIQHLISVNFSQGTHKMVEAQKIKEAHKLQNEKYTFMIVDGIQPIGDISLQIDPPHLEKKVTGTGWLGICIGEPAYRHKGVGKLAMAYIENYARRLGLIRMELGVFEYNTSAIAFYESLGYKRFAELPEFTYYNGDWHTDIRMEKLL